MQSLIVSVQNSDLIPDEARPAIESRVRKGLLGPLSPEREAGPFMLYCCGDDLETISLKTNFPKDVLYVTAIHYDWRNKAKILRNETGDFNPMSIQKDLSNSLLIATYMAAKEQLQDVLAGRKKPSECPLIPKNMHALEKLMNIVANLNEDPMAALQPSNQGGTVVHAQNVQINQSAKKQDETEVVEAEVEETEARKAERAAKYKALRGE